MLGAQRHANPDLVAALRDGERNHSIRTDPGEHEREQREPGEQSCIEPPRRDNRSDHTLERAHVGQRHVADRIVEHAREAGVPIREDPALVEALAKLELEAQIPEELFGAVAETLVWAYRLARRRREA